MSTNRRALLRTLISTSVLGGVVSVGMAELFQLGTANNNKQQQTSQSSQLVKLIYRAEPIIVHIHVDQRDVCFTAN